MKDKNVKEKVEDLVLELVEVEEIKFEPVKFANANSRCCGRGC